MRESSVIYYGPQSRIGSGVCEGIKYPKPCEFWDSGHGILWATKSHFHKRDECTQNISIHKQTNKICFGVNLSHIVLH